MNNACFTANNAAFSSLFDLIRTTHLVRGTIWYVKEERIYSAIISHGKLHFFVALRWRCRLHNRRLVTILTRALETNGREKFRFFRSFSESLLRSFAKLLFLALRLIWERSIRSHQLRRRNQHQVSLVLNIMNAVIGSTTVNYFVPMISLGSTFHISLLR